MLEILYKYFPVFIGSTFKFIGGPLGGLIGNLRLWETILLTVAGMMSSVLLFSFLGNKVRDTILNFFSPERKLFTRKNRQVVNVWQKYGLEGVAFLTPLILTPIGGTLVAVSFGAKPGKIFRYMLISAFFWATMLSYLVDKFGNISLQYLT